MRCTDASAGFRTGSSCALPAPGAGPTSSTSTSVSGPTWTPRSSWAGRSGPTCRCWSPRGAAVGGCCAPAASARALPEPRSRCTPVPDVLTYVTAARVVPAPLPSRLGPGWRSRRLWRAVRRSWRRHWEPSASSRWGVPGLRPAGSARGGACLHRRRSRPQDPDGATVWTSDQATLATQSEEQRRAPGSSGVRTVLDVDEHRHSAHSGSPASDETPRSSRRV